MVFDQHNNKCDKRQVLSDIKLEKLKIFKNNEFIRSILAVERQIRFFIYRRYKINRKYKTLFHGDFSAHGRILKNYIIQTLILCSRWPRHVEDFFLDITHDAWGFNNDVLWSEQVSWNAFGLEHLNKHIKHGKVCNRKPKNSELNYSGRIILSMLNLV